MYIRVTISAVIGKHRQSYAVGASMTTAGQFHIAIDKDVDWTKPIFMILEPDDKEARNAKTYAMATQNANQGDPITDVEIPKCYDCGVVTGKHLSFCATQPKIEASEDYCDKCGYGADNHSDNCIWKDITVAGKPKAKKDSDVL